MSALAQPHTLRALQIRFDNLQPVPAPRNARDEIIDLVMNAEVSEKCVPYYSPTFGIENHTTPFDVVLDELDQKDVKNALLLALINHPQALKDVRAAAARAFADRHAPALEQARIDAAFDARYP